jgi:hypothetical protein
MAKAAEEEGIRFSGPEDLESQVREYVKLKATLESLDARQKELREKLFVQIEENGFEDDKGNVVLELASTIEEVVRLEKQRRVTRKIDETKADEIIADKNLGDEVYEMKRVINEDALMAAHYEGKISEDELDEMFPAKVVWALTTKKK